MTGLVIGRYVDWSSNWTVVILSLLLSCVTKQSKKGINLAIFFDVLGELYVRVLSVKVFVKMLANVSST